MTPGIVHAGPSSRWGRLLKPIARSVFALLLGGKRIDIGKSRRHLNFMGLLSGMPAGLSRFSVLVPGKSNAIKAEWLVPARVGAEAPVILYLHGGGYISGSPLSHRDLAGRLGKAAGARCLVLDYRLAPEAPFPAALEDSIACWRWLLKQGVRPEQIILAGDSAGGGLALATGLRLKQLGLRQPAAYCCLSPWTDLSLSGESIVARQSREVVLANPALLQTAAAAYCAGQTPDQALVSPLFGELEGLAPILIQVGTEEVLLDDSLRFHQRARAAGVNCELTLWEGMWHVWPLLYRTGLPEARVALEKAAVFIQENAGLQARVGGREKLSHSAARQQPTEGAL
ncbi:acetyl esterase/lipase [Litorivivens lipolytica]|uniref:Acetyl esterase/lipase n=1 Tax=Litorivivens lipolytica TaxID=1524264 RepID=A0A7W4W2A9_9GAMM|nr:alpha/beta hydrolase [Litorivivens lipolytica]MBB3045838.1 acetyl esterase/lipase [Litorivivens lipolytica]